MTSLRVNPPEQTGDGSLPLPTGTHSNGVETKREAEKRASDIRQIKDQKQTLLVTATSAEGKYITVARNVVVKARCETLVLVSKKAAVLKEMFPMRM